MTTVRKSLNELTISKERLAQLEALQAADVVTSDIPELDVTFWENAKLSVPAGKKQLTIRLDADVLAWLKAQGKGYQSRINAILRSYYEAHQGKLRNPITSHSTTQVSRWFIEHPGYVKHWV